jgi:hypothetical protein
MVGDAEFEPFHRSEFDTWPNWRLRVSSIMLENNQWKSCWLECGRWRETHLAEKELEVTATSSIYPAHTAVLSMDCQTGIVSIYTKNDEDAFLTRAASVLNHARATGMTIIHIKVGFRPGLPEVSSRNVLFGAIKSSAQHQKLFQEPLGAIPSRIAPKADEIVIIKHRISAFAGTDLAMILRANDIDTLVLYGIATSGASRVDGIGSEARAGKTLAPTIKYEITLHNSLPDIPHIAPSPPIGMIFRFRPYRRPSGSLTDLRLLLHGFRITGLAPDQHAGSFEVVSHQASSRIISPVLPD